MNMKSPSEFVSDNARKNPDAVAIVYGSTTIPYHRLSDAIDRLAAGLYQRGLRRGDRIALMLPNVPHFIISYYALLKLGVWIVPLNIMLKETEVRYILEDSEAKGFIGWQSFSQTLSRAVANLDRCHLQIYLGENLPPGCIDLIQLINAGIPLPLEPVPSDEIAVVYYTAGTTGHPKGAMLSHENLLASVQGCRQTLLVRPEDRFLAVLPLFHSFGQVVGMHVPLASGAVIVLHSKLDSALIIESIQNDRVTIFPGVPGIFEQVLQLKPPKETISTLKYCVGSGAPVTKRLYEEMMNRYGVPILAGYGLSECSPLSAAQQPLGHIRHDSVGMPLPGLEVRILDNTGKTLGPGEVGEIAFSGNTVMRGYLNRSEATKDVLRNGWLMTGDVGYLDADGYLYIVDRKKDLILKAGFNVYPREVEEFINAHPKVEECAVIGVPDKYCGEEVKAYVVLRQGQHSSKDELIQYCRDKIAAYKCPKHVEFCGSLPRGATGKVLKRVLREKRPGGAMPSAMPSPHGSVQPTPVVSLKPEAANNQDGNMLVESTSQGEEKPLVQTAPAVEPSQNNSLNISREQQPL
jgi:long-chain acyl-CoA synthetase